MMAQAKIRIWCIALLIFLISTVALVNAPAESWKQMIVKCSPEDLDRIRTQVGAAIVDAIPGHYLLNVSSSTATSRIEGIAGKGPIQASENSPVSINRRAQTNSNTATTNL